MRAEASVAVLAVATGVILAPRGFELVVDGLVMRIHAIVSVLAILFNEVVSAWFWGFTSVAFVHVVVASCLHF